LYFSFAKHIVKAGCLRCKDLLESGSSLLKYSQICPRVTGQYDGFDCDSDSTDREAFEMDPGLLVEVGLLVVETGTGTVPLNTVTNSDDDLSSVGLHWNEFLKGNVDDKSSIDKVNVWVEKMYASAYNLASLATLDY